MEREGFTVEEVRVYAGGIGGWGRGSAQKLGKRRGSKMDLGGSSRWIEEPLEDGKRPVLLQENIGEGSAL